MSLTQSEFVSHIRHSTSCVALGTAMNTVRASPAWSDIYASKMQPLAAKYGAQWNRTLTYESMDYINDILVCNAASGICSAVFF